MVVQKRRHTHKKKKKREREGLFLGFENFQKKKIYISFSPLSREKRKLFLKNEETLFLLGRERKTARFLNHIESSNIIIVVGCAEKDRR